MARIALDEAASPELHLWMAFMRLLLQVHPRVGADDYSRFVGFGSGMLLRAGWNCIHRAEGAQVPLAYIRVGSGGENEGKLTERRPGVSEDEIHHVEEEALLPFGATRAHELISRLMEASDFLPRLKSGILSPWATVNALAKSPLRAADPSVDQRILDCLRDIRQATDAGASMTFTFERPLEAVVDDFLDFKLTRRQASNIAAVLYLQMAFHIPSPDSIPALDLFKGQIDHLINLASKIGDERHQYDLASFYTLTCLATLYAETAQLMADGMQEHAPADEQGWLEGRSEYIDELSAYRLQPCLLHPFLLVPDGQLSFVRPATLELPQHDEPYEGMGLAGARRMAPQQIWSNLQEFSARARSFPSPLGSYAPLFSVEMRDHLQMFIVTMALGRGTN